jgi:hypothetical protein
MGKKAKGKESASAPFSWLKHEGAGAVKKKRGDRCATGN